jgi:NADPH:quinone reductase-like Zn-dependent oxidoreductase
VGIKKQSINAHNPVSSARLQAASVRRKLATSLVGGEIPLDRFYSELDGHGAGYSSVFTIQPGGGLKADAEYSTCAITVPDTASTMPWSHETPSIASAAFMDLAFQLTFAILGAGRGQIPSLFMPSAIKEVEISRALPCQPGTKVCAVAHGRPDFTSPGPIEFFVDAWHPTEPQQEPLLKLIGLKMTPVKNDNAGGQSPRSLCYKVEWEPLPGKSQTETNHGVTNGQNGYGHGNGDNPVDDTTYARQADVVASNSPSDAATKIDSKPHASIETPHGKGDLAQGGVKLNDEGYLNGDATNSGGDVANATGPTRCEPVPLNGDHANDGASVNGEQNIRWTIEHAIGKPKVNDRQTKNGGCHSSFSVDIAGVSSEADSSIVKTKSVNGSAGPAPETQENGSNCHLAQTAAPFMGDVSDIVVQLITDRDESEPLVSALVELINLHTGSRPSISSLSDVDVSSSTRYICLAELDAPLLRDMSSETFELVKKLLTTCSSVLWVTSGAYRFAERPENNLSQGLLRTVRSEIANAAASLDLDPSSKLEASGRAELILKALNASLATPQDHSPVDFEFVEEGGRLVVPRVVKQQETNLALFRATQQSPPYLQKFQQPGRRLKVAVGTLGALDSLYWEDEPERPLVDHDIEIKVACTGMNFKDVVIAMGQLPSPYLGVECSGTVVRVGPKVTSHKVGDRVCAMTLGAYSTSVRCPTTSAAVIPEDMSFEIAASIPVVYCTTYYGIVEVARMEPGESILIHAASGGVGQAAIQLAQMIGAEIYATVGSVEKKQLLIDTYNLPETHIFYSRDTGFGPAVREATGGKGVDVVINSLAGDLLRETWECLAHFGRFVEIGKRDITSNTRLEMCMFEHNCSFSSVDLTLVAAERPRIMARVFKEVMDLFAKGTVKPITPITTIGISEVETALRRLQSGKTTGKLVVNHLIDGEVKVSTTKRTPFRCIN